jgi:hypothetical protein
MFSFTVADVDRFLAEDMPVVVVNLPRFRPDGGRERYFEYLKMAGPLVARYGAEIIFAVAGDGAQRRWRPSVARHVTPSLWSGSRTGGPSPTWSPIQITTPPTRFACRH